MATDRPVRIFDRNTREFRDVTSEDRIAYHLAAGMAPHAAPMNEQDESLRMQLMLDNYGYVTRPLAAAWLAATRDMIREELGAHDDCR